MVEYANINLEYLNIKLQEKIYNTENPLSFDKLFKAKRLQIFPNILEYLNFKKQNLTGSIINEYTRELFIASHESLRMGDAAYLFQNFNMQKINLSNQEQTDFSVILTDPLLGNSEYLDGLVMKPFEDLNKVNLFKCPISASIGCCNINDFINFLNNVKPRRLLCGEKAFDYLTQTGNTDLTLGFQIEPVLIVGNRFEIIASIDSSFYRGKCSAKLAAEI